MVAIVLGALLSLRQDGGWQLASKEGPATFDNGLVTVRGAGIATYNLPNHLGNSWRIAFSAHRTPHISGLQQYIFVAGTESMLRLDFNQSPTCYAHVFRQDKSLHLSSGDDWHSVELYDLRGVLSLRWDGKVQSITPVEGSPTSIVVGSPGEQGEKPAVEVQLKELSVTLVDKSLANVPPDVPVLPDLTVGEQALLPAFNPAPNPPAIATGIGELLISGNRLSVTAPPLTEIGFAPGPPPDGSNVTDAGLIVDDILKQHERVAIQTDPLPYLSFAIGPRDVAVDNASYQIAGPNGVQTVLRRVHVTVDSSVQDAVQTRLENGSVLLTTKLPATTLYLFDGKANLGSLKLANGAATIPPTSLPSSNNRWIGVAADDGGNVWGPISVNVQIPDVIRVRARVVPSPIPGDHEVQFSYRPQTSIVGTALRLYVNQQFVQESPLGSGRRTVLVDDKSLPAKVEAMLVQPSGENTYGGSWIASLPEPKREIADDLARNQGNSLAVIESSAIGSPPVGLGFVFSSPEYVATCYHLVEPLPGVIVRFADGKTVPVAQIFFDRTSDLAILKLDSPSQRVALQPADKKNMVVGADGNALFKAFGGSAVPTVTQGTIVGRLPSGDIQFSATLTAASDGAPLLGNRGALLGVVDGSFGPSNMHGHRVVSVQTLRRLLKASVP